VAANNKSYLRIAVEQIERYREFLAVKEEAKGLWMHIIGPENEDRGCWSTGCEWAGIGCVRVLATFMKWERSKRLEDVKVCFSTSSLSFVFAFGRW
jgi:hypothetical protein